MPKDISGLTLGDQGFYLAYGGNFGTGNGADSTGNSNNLTEIGTWDRRDKFVDTPSANYATIDPVISNGSTPVTYLKVICKELGLLLVFNKHIVTLVDLDYRKTLVFILQKFW